MTSCPDLSELRDNSSIKMIDLHYSSVSASAGKFIVGSQSANYRADVDFLSGAACKAPPSRNGHLRLAQTSKSEPGVVRKRRV